MSNDMFSIMSGASAGRTATAGGLASATQTPAEGAGAFAAVLAQAAARAGQESVQGQELATDVPAAWVAGSLGLVNVSPSLRVITDGQADVAPDALLAFAQQQGLSPQAIHALQLPLQTGSAAVQGSGQVVPSALGGADAAMTVAALAGGGADRASIAASTWLSAARVGAAGAAPGQGPGVVPSPAQALASSQSLQVPLTSVDQGDAVGVTGFSLRDGGIAPLGASASTVGERLGAAGAPPQALNPLASVTAGSTAQWLQGLRDGVLPSAADAKVTQPVGLDVGLEQAPQLGAVLLPLRSVFKLAMGQQLPEPKALESEVNAPESLVLAGVSTDDVMDVLAHAPALSRHAAPGAAAAVTSTPTLSGADALVAAQDGAQAKYDAVAQKLGEAMGQRLQAQIQRGHWQVSLHLRPQELGSIDVQLGMRGGDLMASFQASHAVTRDMLQDQMPRLREMLAGSGIDVASADVGSQSGGRSGGNSTPSQGQASAQGGAAASTQAATTTELNRSGSVGAAKDDGLDLWA